MDKTRARNLSNPLKGKVCAGWEVISYINCGKSAIVMKAQKGETLAAIKFFDPELIEKHGAEIQTKRIEREKTLIGHSHPNLIQILGGGHWKEEDLQFIVMEFLPWKNLAEVIREVPIGNERKLISQVAAAAQFLEGLKICHRDIKPENIAISNDFQKVKLLDLGVIKPHGTKSITEGSGGKVFVGTLKYSPPEFLVGTEVDSMNGWRALTFYQLGGVLHDLIVRVPLFTGFENPFAVLVNAVQHTKAEIESDSVSPALVSLASNCLLKKPDLRLRLITWSDFQNEPQGHDEVSAIKAKITKRRLADEDLTGQVQKRDAVDRIQEYTQTILQSWRLECIENKSIWPPIQISSAHLERQTWITARFDPSNTHKLANHLTLQVGLEWIDADQDVIRLTFSACVSGKEIPLSERLPKSKGEIFEGVFTAESARKAILTPAYKALEACLEFKRNLKDKRKITA